MRKNIIIKRRKRPHQTWLIPLPSTSGPQSASSLSPSPSHVGVLALSLRDRKNNPLHQEVTALDGNDVLRVLQPGHLHWTRVQRDLISVTRGFLAPIGLHWGGLRQ